MGSVAEMDGTESMSRFEWQVQIIYATAGTFARENRSAPRWEIGEVLVRENLSTAEIAEHVSPGDSKRRIVDATSNRFTR
jgi:hypothetical protein